MSKPIAILFADLHMQERVWSHRNIIGDTDWALKQIIDYAIAHDVKTLIGAGDLLDKRRNTAHPVVTFCKELDRLAEHGGELWYTQGQHEFDLSVPWLEVHSATRYAHKQQFQVGDLSVYGLDFQPKEKLQEHLDAIPAGTDTLIAHQVWSDFMGDIASPQGGFSDVPTVSTVFTGDYHKHTVKTVTGKDGQDLTAISPGACCMQAINEPTTHYFYVLDDSGDFWPVELISRPKVDFKMLDESAVDDIIESIPTVLKYAVDFAVNAEAPESVREPLVHVTYLHDLNVSDRIKDAIKAAKIDYTAHLFEKELPPPSYEGRNVTEDGKNDDGSVTLLSSLKPYLAAVDALPLDEPCRRLLTAVDIEEELDRMQEEHLNKDK